MVGLLVVCVHDKSFLLVGVDSRGQGAVHAWTAPKLFLNSAYSKLPSCRMSSVDL